MKKILFLFLALALVACDNNKGYTLNFNLPDQAGKQLVVNQRIPGEWISLDSVVLDSSGLGEISGFIEMPEMVNVAVTGSRGYMKVFLDNVDYDISGTMIDPVIDATSGPQLVYNNFQMEIADLLKQRDEITERYWKANEDSAGTEVIEAIVKEYDELTLQKEQTDSIFIVNNPGSVVSAYMLRNRHYQFSTKELESWLNILDPTVYSSSYYILMNEHLQKMKKVQVGEMYTDFTLPDPDGNAVSLSDIAGNGVVLIDFWASWCSPCRAANPGVVALYKEFHEKGFDILGVSLDRNRDEWLKAIEDDGLVWTQISDIKYWQCEAAQLYAVNSIPATVLLDKEGKIIAKNLGEEELKAKLVELLGD
jgi:peroxiredoxin